MIMDKLSAMHTELALNTRETSRIAEYQKATNGKVAAQESRLQNLEGAQALTTTTLAQMNQAREKRQDRILSYKDKVVWVIIGGMMVWIGRLVTYAIQSDFLKNIVK